MDTRRLYVVLLAALPLTACDVQHGEGTLIDRGPTATSRYTLDLGAVSLTRAGSVSFKVGGLPSTEFTAGLRPVTGCDANTASRVRVKLSIRTEKGEPVVSEEGPLSSWVASEALLYVRGKVREVPQSNGVFHQVRESVRTSDGWGTYFTPGHFATYAMTLEVLTAASGCESRLVLVSGGWK